MGVFETHTKHEWDTEIGTQKRIYIISKRKSYNTPKLGQTKNEVGMSWDSAKTSQDNLPKR